MATNRYVVTSETPNVDADSLGGGSHGGDGLKWRSDMTYNDGWVVTWNSQVWQNQTGSSIAKGREPGVAVPVGEATWMPLDGLDNGPPTWSSGGTYPHYAVVASGTPAHIYVNITVTTLSGGSSPDMDRDHWMDIGPIDGSGDSSSSSPAFPAVLIRIFAQTDPHTFDGPTMGLTGQYTRLQSFGPSPNFHGMCPRSWKIPPQSGTLTPQITFNFTQVGGPGSVGVTRTNTTGSVITETMEDLLAAGAFDAADGYTCLTIEFGAFNTGATVSATLGSFYVRGYQL